MRILFKMGLISHIPICYEVNKCFWRFNKLFIKPARNTYTLSNLPHTGSCYETYQPHFEQSDWSIHYKHVREAMLAVPLFSDMLTNSMHVIIAFFFSFWPWIPLV